MGTSMYLLALLLIPQIVFSSPLQACNSSIHFDCKVGGTRRCIPLEWQCDNVPDCENGSDEHDCNYLHHCSPGMMMCRGGPCISMVFKCDGEIDCGLHGNDEHSCEGYDISHLRSGEAPDSYRTRSEECASPKYMCKSGNQCLGSEALCDGVVDCPDEDDEVGCHGSVRATSDILSAPNSSETCDYGHKRCATGDTCIPTWWICDDENDCPDGSDEENCPKNDGEALISFQSNRLLCKPNQYRCQGEFGACIPENLTCNNHQDCPYGDDEGPQCTECSQQHCEYKCRLSHNGPQCYCPDGSKLNADGLTCSEVSMCETEGGKLCQHYCEDRGTSYVCRCASKYSLGRDGHTCHADKHDGLLLLGVASEVRNMPLHDAAHSNDGYKALKHVHGSVKSLDYNYGTSSVYIGITHHLHDMDGDLVLLKDDKTTILRQNILGLDSVAVDYIGGNIYYAQKASSSAGIHVCTGDGLFCRKIVDGSPTGGSDKKLQQYRGLALNPSRGVMVWIEGVNNKFRIMMSNMDGTEPKVLVDSKLDDPRGITFDPIGNDVYYADCGTGLIEKVNVATRERKVVVSRGVHHPFDLKYFDGYLYWTDWGSETLKVIQISDHHSTVQTMHTFNHLPMGLAVNHSSYQLTPSVDPCLRVANSCKWMCTPVPDLSDGVTASCVCPDNYDYSELEQKCVPNKLVKHDDNSVIGLNYVEELCENDKFCLNGGACLKEKIGQITSRISCTCAEGFIGNRCEVSDPRANNLVGERQDDSSGWMVFWFLFFVFILIIVAFFFLYQKSRRVNEFTKSTLDRVGQLESPDLSKLRPIVQNVKEKLQTLPSRVPVPGSLSTHFSNSQTEGANVDPASAPLVVTFNNPLYSDVQPVPSTESLSENEVSYANKFAN